MAVQLMIVYVGYISNDDQINQSPLCVDGYQTTDLTKFCKRNFNGLMENIKQVMREEVETCKVHLMLSDLCMIVTPSTININFFVTSHIFYTYNTYLPTYLPTGFFPNSGKVQWAKSEKWPVLTLFFLCSSHYKKKYIGTVDSK